MFNSTLARVAILQEEIISSLSLDLSTSSAPSVSISIPLTEDKTKYISPAYFLKIWNETTQAYEHSVFELCDPDIEDSSGSLKITATYQGILTRLSGEDIDAYDTGSAGTSFETVITELLAFQLNTPAITLGTIEPVQTVALSVESTNIYAALNAVRDAFGGWFEVDPDLKLNWYADNTNDPEREIRRSKNLKSLTYTPSYTSVVNRVYAYGKGESDARITLLDAGEAHEYIEDTASQAIYGIKAKRYVDKSITHPITLLAYANRILAEYKTPPYQYSVDVVNLAEVNEYDYTLESLGLDTRVRVIDDLLSVDVNTSIVSMSVDLLNPSEITIELSTVKTDLSDLFKDVLTVQNINQSVAAQISAGQVTVLGTFVVKDWASAGVTTIDGSKITASTITTSQLNFTPIDSSTIIASINASSEGIDINGSKIAISGDTTFAAGYNPTTKIASGGAATDINNNITTISGGKITTNTITANALTTSTMTSRTITLSGADSILQGNYTAGSAGWQIKGDGNAEFNNVTIRGTLEACTVGTGQTLSILGDITLSGSADMRIIGSNGTISFYDNTSDYYPKILIYNVGTPTISMRNSGSVSAEQMQLTSNYMNYYYGSSYGILLDREYCSISVGSSSSTNSGIKLKGLDGSIYCVSINASDSGDGTIHMNSPVLLNNNTLYFGDTSHYLYSSGSTLYWFNGSSYYQIN